jgi:hypothetical protein
MGNTVRKVLARSGYGGQAFLALALHLTTSTVPDDAGIFPIRSLTFDRCIHIFALG